MKSKKWARRRPVVVRFTAANGWHCKVKFRRHQWEFCEDVMKVTGETVEEFFIRIIRKAIEFEKWNLTYPVV